jgi:hypothetical protein
VIKAYVKIKDNKIVAKPVFATPSTPQNIIVVKGTTNIQSTGRFDKLLDVEEGNSPISGSAPIYDELTDKYIIKKIDLDGGTF